MTDYVSAYDKPGSIYHDEAVRCAERLWTETTLDSAGVLRWNSNGAVPPAECIALGAHIGMALLVSACTAARDEDTTRFLAAYRAARKTISAERRAEERAEARAAHGPGHEIVNVITGERITT